jgi:hypothetical protein
MAIFHQEGQKVETQINEGSATSSVKIYGQAITNLRELSDKRKNERHQFRTQESIVEQLINQAHKREVK